MALTVDAIRERVANRLFSKAYADLTTLDKARIDNEGADALAMIVGVAKFWPQADNAPSDWQTWFVDEVVWRVAQSTHPERASEYRRTKIDSRADAIGSFCRKAMTYNPASDTEAFAYSAQNVRYHVLAHTTRMRPPLFPEPSAIDAALGWALGWVWNAGSWSFRRRHTTITLASNGTVTVNGLGSDTFDSIASYEMFHETIPNERVVWASADDMAALKSGQSAETGRPERFRIQTAGNTPTWTFWPIPDAEYVFRCEVLIRGPGDPSSATETTTMAKFASEMLPTIRDLVLAKVLNDHGVELGRALLEDAKRSAQELFSTSQQTAQAESAGQQRDVYGDAYELNPRNGL